MENVPKTIDNEKANAPLCFIFSTSYNISSQEWCEKCLYNPCSNYVPMTYIPQIGNNAVVGLYCVCLTSKADRVSRLQQLYT